MKKYRLFDICKLEPLPLSLVFDCDSAFFGKFGEFDWFKENPLTAEAMKTKQKVFDLNSGTMIANVVSDMKPNGNNVVSPMVRSRV